MCDVHGVDRQRRARRHRRVLIATVAVIVCSSAWAHVFIPAPLRAGAYPPWPGGGWVGEAFLNLPAESAVHLIAAENYVETSGVQPDFTFRTDWIDFPAGEQPYGLDTEFATVGDLLNDYIWDVSDPAKLDEPLSHFLLRFRGFVRVATADNMGPPARLPVWIDMATTAHDGFRTRISETIYRLPITQPGNASFRENAIVMALGLFPIEVTYLNRYDPTGLEDWRNAGIEFYSWHESGPPRPGTTHLEDPLLGFPTLFPPHVVYQTADVLPILPGDFEADSDVDLADQAAFQECFTGPPDENKIVLELGCAALDLDGDADVDRHDLTLFIEALTGPGG